MRIDRSASWFARMSWAIGGGDCKTCPAIWKVLSLNCAIICWTAIRVCCWADRLPPASVADSSIAICPSRSSTSVWSNHARRRWAAAASTAASRASPGPNWMSNDKHFMAMSASPVRKFSRVDSTRRVPSWITASVPVAVARDPTTGLSFPER